MPVDPRTVSLPFVPTRHPAIDGARTRSAPINAAWLSGPLRAATERFAGSGDPRRIEAQAAELLADSGQIEALLAPLIAALRADPWFEPPFKVSRDRLRTSAVLLDCPAVTISATITSAAMLNRLPAPATIVAPGRVTLTRYFRGGGAYMRRWDVPPGGSDFNSATAPPACERSARTLADGDLVRQDGRISGHLLTRAENDIVALTATIKPGACPLMREYAAADGRFVRAASADDAASRIEMLLTFLRISNRGDASAVFDAASRHPAFHLRWAAMREWLLLDARAAHNRLSEMHLHDLNAEIRTAAGTTLAALEQRLRQSCPA